jgi:hypothetical protein
MNPIMWSEIVRMIHDDMLRDQEERRRQLRTRSGFRHGIAVALVALGDRLDPSVRRPTLPVASIPGQRLRVA